MSNINSIIIKIDNLSDEEQIKLWIDLYEFASKQLPPAKELVCIVNLGKDFEMKIHLDGMLKSESK